MKIENCFSVDALKLCTALVSGTVTNTCRIQLNTYAVVTQLTSGGGSGGDVCTHILILLIFFSPFPTANAMKIVIRTEAPNDVQMT